MFYKKGTLKNFAKFTGKHLCQSLLFNKVAGLRFAAVSNKRLWQRCFLLNFVQFLRTPSLQNTSGQLLHYLRKPCKRMNLNLHGLHRRFQLRISLDTRRKLDVRETFRRCPGRLLNVLSRFNVFMSSWIMCKVDFWRKSTVMQSYCKAKLK